MHVGMNAYIYTYMMQMYMYGHMVCVSVLYILIYTAILKQMEYGLHKEYTMALSKSIYIYTHI